MNDELAKQLVLDINKLGLGDPTDMEAFVAGKKISMELEEKLTQVDDSLARIALTLGDLVESKNNEQR